VLAVDDNEINRLVLADMLAQEGARVTCLAGGHEAIAHLTEVGPDSYHIVLTDIQMPDMDGYALTLQLRADYPACPSSASPPTPGPRPATPASPPACAPICQNPSSSTTWSARSSSTPPTAGARSAAPPRAAHGARSRPGELAGAGSPVQGPAAVRRAGRPQGAGHLPNELVRLRELADGEGELAALAFLAHGIKGSAGALHATSVHQLAAEVDAAARAGSADARELAGKLADQLEALLGELEMRVAADSTRPHDFSV
jgi:CheY-like chemotaxis protein/HPt (histidine-containing phosphotransfer) domain-containing protein